MQPESAALHGAGEHDIHDLVLCLFAARLEVSSQPITRAALVARVTHKVGVSKGWPGGVVGQPHAHHVGRQARSMKVKPLKQRLPGKCRVDEELEGDLEPVQGKPNEDQHLARGKYRVGGAIGPAEMRLHHQLAQYACDQGTEQSAVPRHLLQEVLKLLIDWTACWI